MANSDVIDTIIAEAGADPKAQAAVAHVINNRAKAWGMTPEQVVKQSGQFEGYSNPGSKSKEAQKLGYVRERARKAWEGVTSGTIPDPTSGALNFRSAGTKIHAPYGTVSIGGNVFAKGNAASQAIDAAFSPSPMPTPPGLAYAENGGASRPPYNPMPLSPDAMNGVRMPPGQHPTIPPMTPGLAYQAPNGPEGLSDPRLASLMRPQFGPGMNASGMSGGVPPMSGSAVMQAPSGAMRASGLPPPPQMPASVSMQAPPNVPLPRPNPMVAPGNLNLDQRKVYNAPDGSYRTENSISIGTDRGEVLIPTVVGGKQLSNEEAIRHYQQTGENLGTFKTPTEADNYAQQLHLRQAKSYAPSVSRETLPPMTMGTPQWRDPDAPAPTWAPPAGSPNLPDLLRMQGLKPRGVSTVPNRPSLTSRSVSTVPVSASGLPANTIPTPMQRPPSLFGERGQMIAAGLSGGSPGLGGSTTMNGNRSDTRPLSAVVEPSRIPMSERVPRTQPNVDMQAVAEREAARMRQQQLAAIQPPKPTPTWSSAPPPQIAAYGSPPMPPSIPQIPQTAYIPGASGTTDPNKDPSQLQPQPPGNEFAYGPPAATAPGVAAIDAATIPLPRPRPMPPNTLPNGMPIDSSVPLNASTYRPPQSSQFRAPVSVPQVPSVRLASGRTVPVGTQGSAQGGRYQYQVQPDGTVVNTKTGKPAGYSAGGLSLLQQFGN